MSVLGQLHERQEDMAMAAAGAKRARLEALPHPRPGPAEDGRCGDK
ncbi:hypothetical protein ACIGXM_36070 [Kitasatospora sp. NPDC052896]